MHANKLTAIRKQAEQAVRDMADGPAKLKAFEVILVDLLRRADDSKPPQSNRRAGKRQAPSGEQPEDDKSAGGRIMVLANEGFFKELRSISEVRDQLAVHGWNYPLTTLSGRLQALVQKRGLRRIRSKQDKKTIWKYSDP